MFKHASRLAVAITAASVFSAAVHASGYKVNEQAAKASGRAFAGSAAVADDASVVFFNPAGMSRLKTSQASFGFTYLSLNGDLDGVRFGLALQQLSVYLRALDLQRQKFGAF